MNRRTTLFGLLATPFAFFASLAKGGENTMNLKSEEQFQQALRSPQSFMFSDQATSKVDPHSYIRVRSVAANADGKPRFFEMKSGTMRIFRADSTTTPDGKHGELRWTVGSEERTTQIKEPGAVIMVVRSLDGTINWYSLQVDFRC